MTPPTATPIRPLTPREAAVAELLADGLTTPAVALRLGRSYHTVVALIRRMGTKLPGAGHDVGRIRAHVRAERAQREARPQ